jgi:hypothetical protein
MNMFIKLNFHSAPNKDFYLQKISKSMQRTEVHFASFLSGGFTNMAVINPPERELAKRTSVQRFKSNM